jgi:acid phosphatase family membrane protein YuiD
VGNQTGIINQFIDDFLEKGEFKYEKLSEFLGHTPLEVLAGSLLGIGVAFSLFY